MSPIIVKNEKKRLSTNSFELHENNSKLNDLSKFSIETLKQSRRFLFNPNNEDQKSKVVENVEFVGSNTLIILEDMENSISQEENKAHLTSKSVFTSIAATSSMSSQKSSTTKNGSTTKKQNSSKLNSAPEKNTQITKFFQYAPTQIFQLNK